MFSKQQTQFQSYFHINLIKYLQKY